MVSEHLLGRWGGRRCVEAVEALQGFSWHAKRTCRVQRMCHS